MDQEFFNRGFDKTSFGFTDNTLYDFNNTTKNNHTYFEDDLGAGGHHGFNMKDSVWSNDHQNKLSLASDSNKVSTSAGSYEMDNNNYQHPA